MVATTQKRSVKAGYKQTDVGVIPGHWEVRRLGELTAIKGRIGWKGYTINDLRRSGPLVIGGTQISPEHKLDFSKPVYLSREKFDESPEIKIRRGDLVLVKTGNTIGKVALVDQDIGDACVNPNVVIIRPLDCFSQFLYHVMTSARFQRMIWESVEVGAQPSVNQKKLRALPIVFPSLPEQHAIASALGDVTALISSLEVALSKKRSVKTAAMQQLLTCKRRLPGFSGKWELRRLEDVADVDPENLDSNTSPDYYFKYISLEDVDTGTLLGYTEQMFRTAPSRARRKLRKGDVLVSTVRPNLKSHLLIKGDVTDTVCSTGFSVVRCKSALCDAAFLYFHLFSGGIERQIESVLTGSNYPAISSGDVRALRIPCPSLAEQIAIAAVLSDMDAEIAAVEGRREKTQALKQGMMQQLLTGSIRLI